MAFVDLGEHLPIKLQYLAKKLNSLQSSFLFSEEAPLTSRFIGKPDLEFQWYYLEQLFDLLRNHPRYLKFDYLVGVTHVRVTKQMRDEGDIANKDYFSLRGHLKSQVAIFDAGILARRRVMM